jgi:hypothetical protein
MRVLAAIFQARSQAKDLLLARIENPLELLWSNPFQSVPRRTELSNIAAGGLLLPRTPGAIGRSQRKSGGQGFAPLLLGDAACLLFESGTSEAAPAGPTQWHPWSSATRTRQSPSSWP